MAEISNRAVATAAAGAVLAVGLAFVSPSDGAETVRRGADAAVQHVPESPAERPAAPQHD